MHSNAGPLAWQASNPKSLQAGWQQASSEQQSRPFSNIDGSLHAQQLANCTAFHALTGRGMTLPKGGGEALEGGVLGIWGLGMRGGARSWE